MEKSKIGGYSGRDIYRERGVERERYREVERDIKSGWP